MFSIRCWWPTFKHAQISPIYWSSFLPTIVPSLFSPSELDRRKKEEMKPRREHGEAMNDKFRMRNARIYLSLQHHWLCLPFFIHQLVSKRFSVHCVLNTLISKSAIIRATHWRLSHFHGLYILVIINSLNARAESLFLYPQCLTQSALCPFLAPVVMPGPGLPRVQGS